METPHGTTLIEVIVVVSVITAVILLIVFFVNPFNRLQMARNAIRTEDVRDYMEALLEIQQRDIDAFKKILDLTSSEKVVIGENTCEGSFGTHCSDSEVQNNCLSIGFFDGYLNDLPFDPKRGYSELQTGYYVSSVDGVLEVGSCESENGNNITLRFEL